MMEIDLIIPTHDISETAPTPVETAPTQPLSCMPEQIHWFANMDKCAAWE